MPLSMIDKMIRLNLMTFPRPLNVAQFYPALSTYSVEQPFSLDDFRDAADFFLDENPLFPKFHLIERQFESPEEFPVSSFQGIVLDEYPNYYDGFLLMSVTYKSDPNVQGIFTAFPMSMQDGYRCFLFHQALMSTMKAGKDQFRIAEAIADLQLQTADLDQYLPARKPFVDADHALGASGDRRAGPEDRFISRHGQSGVSQEVQREPSRDEERLVRLEPSLRKSSHVPVCSARGGCSKQWW
jgi:hypothetical protein